MALLALSFFAGVLTIAAPCILPLLPVIIGGSLVHDPENEDRTSSHLRPLWITLGLVLSVILFTLLLKATTSLLGVPQMVWQILSGGIVLLFGFYFLFPTLWDRLVVRFQVQGRSQELLKASQAKKGFWGSLLMGGALGPVFNSCSPTYALIVAAVLPASFSQGMVYLVAYAVGLGVTLLLVAYLGRVIVQKLGVVANPHGWFRRVIGMLFVLVGVAVLFGIDKKIQASVLEKGWYDPIAGIEQRLRR